MQGSTVTARHGFTRKRREKYESIYTSNLLEKTND